MGRVGLVFTKQYVEKNISKKFIKNRQNVVTCAETSLGS